MSRSDFSPIKKRISAHIDRCFPSVADPFFIVGVSGGPDSMALLYLLHKLDMKALAVHINYQKRGEASDMDQELVEQMASQWDFDCHTLRLDTTDAEGTNFQQWARKQRYGIFRELLEEYRADAILTAHHEDDQVETVLQKVFRGAGLESWQGMQVWEPPLFRPLLGTKREEIMDFVDEHAVPYRTDQSNLESDFARNLLRNEWLDKLGDFFPGWRQNVLRLPRQAKIFEDALQVLAAQLTDEKDRVHADKFLKLETSLQKALLLHLLKSRDPDITVSTGALDQLESLDQLQTGQEIQLTDRYSLMRDRQWLKLVVEHTDSFKGIELNLDELREHPFSFNGLIFEVQPYDDPNFEAELHLDLSKLAGSLTLRQWRAGDAFQPFGMEGHQKVSDHLTNRKISASLKDRALVLESFEETIYAVIFPPLEKIIPPGTISELAKCHAGTTESLVITWN